MHPISRSLIIISFILISCGSGSSLHKRVGEELPKILTSVLETTCSVEENIDKTLTSVSVATQLRPFEVLENERFANFEIDDFLSEAVEVEYKLTTIQSKSLDIVIADIGEITKQPITESIHNKYLLKNPKTYCYGTIFSKPMARFRNSGEIELLIKAIRYLEYPVETIYFHAIIAKGEITLRRLDLESVDTRFY